VNQALSYLPSVEVRDQQGDEVSRPQSRGFHGGIFQNTRESEPNRGRPFPLT
jgi:iron complex outermembrane receptor protein